MTNQAIKEVFAKEGYTLFVTGGVPQKGIFHVRSE
jgi:hypothetical protein